MTAGEGGGGRLNFNTCPNMVTEVKKHAKRIFYIFDLVNYKKQSKYRFRQLVHTELQYWIFTPRTSHLSMQKWWKYTLIGTFHLKNDEKVL